MHDDVLTDAIDRSGRGRLTFDPTHDLLRHTRLTGTVTPVVATAAQVRSLMTLLVLLSDEPAGPVPTIDRGADLLVDLLDRHPVRAVLGWQHLRDAARDPGLRDTDDLPWGDSA